MPHQNTAIPQAPAELIPGQDRLSPWWLRAVLAVMVIGFSVLILLTIKVHYEAPPIPDEVVDSHGHVLFTKQNVLAGQEVFLKHGLMDNGSIWGHGGYLGPDFSARYLHSLATQAAQTVATQRYGKSLDALGPEEHVVVAALVRSTLKQNRYDPTSARLTFSEAEADSYGRQIQEWGDYFSKPAGSGGLPTTFIQRGSDLRDLTSFFAWSAWASVTNRPGEAVSYTNNFPYDPLAGNVLPGRAVLWSALSLIALLGGTALVLLAFGKFDYLGWKSSREPLAPRLVPGNPTPVQRAVVKYLVIVMLLFMAQALVGGVTAHYRAEPGDFYGFDLSAFLPSNIVRTWHLQLAIFWIATAYVAGALLLAAELGNRELKPRLAYIQLLFAALVIVVVGSLLGE